MFDYTHQEHSKNSSPRDTEQQEKSDGKNPHSTAENSKSPETTKIITEGM